MKLSFLMLTASLILAGCSQTAILQRGQISRDALIEAYNSVRPVKTVEVTLNNGEVVYGEDFHIEDDNLAIRGKVAKIIPNSQIKEVSIKSYSSPPRIVKPFVGVLIFPVVVILYIPYWMGLLPP